ncbi:MAG: TrkH family potassium uptake protein [Clostridiaceae bacterium]|nr:TrkH family potassium uptake protein [Clostridiaceae bacterium]
MNIRLIIKNLSIVICIEALCMLFPFLIALIYGQNDAMAFLLSALITFCAGLLMLTTKVKTNNFYTRDGFAVVALSWIFVSVFGSLPFLLSGTIPSPVNAFFETVSGFSTTGATILDNVETLPRGIIFWRSFTQWMGGMGVLVLTAAVLPSAGASFYHVLKAESPGPNPEKLVPKIGQTAKILYSIYIVLTSFLVILLLIAGMPLYDALVHAFATAGTGGFSSKTLSIGAYGSVFIDVIITVFMFLFGINFTLYYHTLKGNFRSFFKNEEFRFYIGLVFASIIAITLNLVLNGFYSFGEGLRHSAFQVNSIISTTGYSTTDFNLWPVFSKFILVMLMFIGPSAGSTGGSVKCIRFLLLFKIIKRELAKIIHPRVVHTVMIAGKAVDETTLWGTMAFFFIYIIIFVISSLIVALDGKDLISSVTAVITSIGNIGPGLGIIGPMGNYSGFSDLSKIVLSFCMIAGRLEIMPLLVLFSPAAWKRASI